MAGNEGSTAVTAAQVADGPTKWGRMRRMTAALLVASALVGASSVVFAGPTSAQTESDAVLQWLPEIQAASAATGVPPEYIAAVIRVESVGDPNAVSSAGALGLMQVMPAEFQSQGIPESSWFDPATNILAGSTEIGKFLASTGSIEQALASYFGSGCDSTGTCTDSYLSMVLGFAAAYADAIANGTAVDTSGVATTTGSGTTLDSNAGSVDSGTSGYGSWQDDAPPVDDGGWQGTPPDGGDWHGEPPQDGPGGDETDDTGADDGFPDQGGDDSTPGTPTDDTAANG
jgi:hypothetical protein